MVLTVWPMVDTGVASVSAELPSDTGLESEHFNTSTTVYFSSLALRLNMPVMGTNFLLLVKL